VSLLGINLALLVGQKIALPAPRVLIEALSSVEVTHNDQERSGFQLTFQVGRSGPLDLIDYKQLVNPALLKPFNRVVIVIHFRLLPQVLMDGVITNIQLSPGDRPGSATLTVTGEDLSILMDMDNDKNTPWPSLGDDNIVRLIVAKYGQYTILPLVSTPSSSNIDSPTKHIRVQQTSDLEYIKCLAARQGFVFYIEPGPLPNTSTAYWGSPKRTGQPQKALSVNMGPDSNVESINFDYNALGPTLIVGKIQDSQTNKATPIRTAVSTRTPLASQPALVANQPNVRHSRLPVSREETRRQAEMSRTNGAQTHDCDGSDISGLDQARATSRAQSMVDASTDNVVTATGELNAVVYGNFLRARGRVGLRGAGGTYDGDYYVKSVTHSIRKGEYKQRFYLTREGTGTRTLLVRPS
jgi:hypothetical protein